jgi:hypothetical protein
MELQGKRWPELQLTQQRRQDEVFALFMTFSSCVDSVSAVVVG